MDPSRKTLCSTLLLLIALFTTCRAQGTVRIGVFAPSNGSEAAVGQATWNGANLALVNQTRIALTRAASDCAGTLIVNGLKDFISKGFVGAIGDRCSGSTLAAARYINESKSAFVLISQGSTSPLLTTAGPYIFRTVPSDVAQGAKLAGIIGKRKAALVFGNEPYGVGLAAVITDRVVANGGSIVWAKTITAANDTEAYVEELLDSKPQIIVVMVNDQTIAPEVLQLLDEYNYNGVVWGSDSLASQSVVNASNGAADMLKLKVVAPTTGTPAFKAAYARAYGSQPVSYHAASAYDAALAFARAINITSNPVTAAKLAASLLRLPAFAGATGNVKFDANGDRLFGSYECLQAVNGTLVAFAC